MAETEKGWAGRLQRWREKRRVKREPRANRSLPLLDSEQRGREEARRDSPAGSHDSSAWGVGFGGHGEGGGDF
jgi:hypothetical protein